MEELEPQFVDKVSVDLVCPICRMLLQEPQQTNCGHEFCRECVRPLMRDGKLTCPVCRAESLSNQIFDDKRFKREIMGRTINCDQNGKGCKWSRELRQREKHNEEYEYMTKPCVNKCGQVVMRKDMEGHMTSKCPLRIVACDLYGEKGKYSLLTQHYSECEKYPMQCVYKCGMTVTRGEMKKHTSLEGTCPNSPLDCDFHDIGCEFKGIRHELDKHIETGSTAHLRLFLAEMRGIKHTLDEVQNKLSEESNWRCQQVSSSTCGR